MKTERRHELQQNVLADWLGEQVTWARDYSRAIMATIVGVLVIVCVYLYTTQKSSARQAQVWQEYLAATTPNADMNDKLTTLADKASDTSAGRWARLRLADQQLNQGCDQLFQNRGDAGTSLNDAEKNYEKLKNASESVIRERATLGLAKTYEALDRLEDAEKTYAEFIKQYPSSVLASFAKTRLEDLKKPATKDFYAWFAAQGRKSAMENEPGIPGHKFDFNSSSIPSPRDESPSFDLKMDRNSQALINDKATTPATTTNESPETKTEPKGEAPKSEEKPASTEKPADAKPSDAPKSEK